MGKTVKIRIPVAVDLKGRVYAYAWADGKGGAGPRNHDELLEVVDLDSIGPNEALFWVTAELPVPEPQETAGEVETV